MSQNEGEIMKKSTILLSTLVLGLTLTSPAYARSHGGAHGHHSSHGSHHSPHISHDSHISEHKSPSTKSPSTKSSKSTKPSTKSTKPSTKPSAKSTKSTDSSKSTKFSTKPSKSTKKDYSIKHPYNDQEAFDVFKSNKLQSSYQKAYRRQSIFNNPWIWMYCNQ